MDLDAARRQRQRGHLLVGQPLALLLGLALGHVPAPLFKISGPPAPAVRA